MVKYIFKRFGQIIILFYVFLALLFLLLDLQPGDISQQFVGNPDIPPEAKRILIEQLGLDQPKIVQLGHHLWNYSFGADMGVSWDRYPQSVSGILMKALPRTLFLFLTATVLSFWLGFSTGKLVAWRRGTVVEKSAMVASIFFWTIFYPWFALLMLWFTSSVLGWFPVGKFITVDKWIGAPFTADSVFLLMLGTAALASTIYGIARYVIDRSVDDPASRKRYHRIAVTALFLLVVLFWALNTRRTFAGDILLHTFVPVFTLTLVNYAGTTLLTRSSMLETLREDYILTARAKGVPEKQIRDRHAARNAMLPVTTSLVLQLALVIAGGVITEQIFSWPGLGRALLTAITVEDIPVAMGALAMIGVLSLVAHLVADITYAFLDPRIRVQG
jgi:peptide/nickel transport system permease protein